MQISVVIVNYNVRYFLEHCLSSVVRAAEGMDVEIFVVDNQSTDDSVEMVMKKFPQVTLIANLENVGFARANNMAVQKATGNYILYLNPDTIVPEDCFQSCFTYMEEHSDVGALGCRLIDGKGQFLPESKRGFPSASVAFLKIIGLSSLFKKSRFFNRYHLGYLHEHSINDVDVLVGCFMFCRKTVIDETKGFDEDYFMYGEDIDLSYKIKKAGYRNVYFPKVTVIHYKGESTSKGSLNYVKMFYKAMIIFAKKHLESGKKGLYVALIQVAIYLRAVVALTSRVFSIIRLPLLDALVMMLSLIVVKNLWLSNIKPDTRYASPLLAGFFTTYVLVWILSVYLNGGYDKPYKAARVMRGMLIGGGITMLIYGLLPESFRFSRGITVLSALVATLAILGVRKIMQWLGIKRVESDVSSSQRVMVVGTPEEEHKVKSLLSQAFIEKKIIGSISPHEQKEAYQIGSFSQTAFMAKLYQITEVIFVQGQLGFKQIIDAIQACGPTLEYKIHAMGHDSIIGSNSKNTAGDLYTTEVVYQISTVEAKRNKRTVDVCFSLLFILLSPVLIWFVRYKGKYFYNQFLILEGDKTFVGYQDDQFPKLKPYLFTVFPIVDESKIPHDNQEHLNWLYAKNYDAWQDVSIILQKWRQM